MKDPQTDGLDVAPAAGPIRNLLAPLHLRRTGLTAFVVGSWLTLINQADVLMAGSINGLFIGKILTNYLTPFVVANIGLLSRQHG